MTDDTRDANGYLKPECCPLTVDQAVDMVIGVLDDEGKRRVASSDKAERARLHMGLGLWIRNQFGLWQGNQALKTSCALTVAKNAGSSLEGLAEVEARLTADGKRAWRVYLQEKIEQESEVTPWMFWALRAAHHADSASAVIIDETARRLRESMGLAQSDNQG